MLYLSETTISNKYKGECMGDFVAYYRVSTARQGQSGLGLDAQRDAVQRFIGVSGSLAAEFTEIESGRRASNRPQLQAALAECRRTRATLVIARLDRLARNVAFVAGLMESGVDFVAVDMPTANRLTIHILAAVAENEQALISARTKAALAVAKARGTRLGNPRWPESIATARAARTASPTPPHLVALMQQLRTQGKTLRAIADALNSLNSRGKRGGAWNASTVRAELLRQTT